MAVLIIAENSAMLWLSICVRRDGVGYITSGRCRYRGAQKTPILRSEVLKSQYYMRELVITACYACF